MFFKIKTLRECACEELAKEFGSYSTYASHTMRKPKKSKLVKKRKIRRADYSRMDTYK